MNREQAARELAKSARKTRETLLLQSMTNSFSFNAKHEMEKFRRQHGCKQTSGNGKSRQRSSE